DKTLAELQTQSTYSDTPLSWNFDDIWTMDIYSGFPILKIAAASAPRAFDASVALGKWALVSVPKEEWKVSDFSFKGSPSYYAKQMQGDGTWTSYQSGNIDLNAGDAFALKYRNDISIANYTAQGNKKLFVAPFVTADVTKEVAAGSRYALTGNPYTEDITAENISLEDNLKDGIFILNDDGNSYISPDIAGVTIPAFTGFIVESYNTEADGSVEFTAPVSVAGAPSSTTTASPKITVTASNEFGSGYTIVKNNDNGQGVVGRYDMSFLNAGEQPYPQLFTTKATTDGATQRLAINTVNTDNTTIPLGIFTTYNGTIILSFAGMDTYHCDVTLLANGESTDISGLSAFTLTTYVDGNADGSFAIALSPKVPTGINNAQSSNVQAFDMDGKINIVSTDLLHNVSIYGIDGKLIYSTNKINSTTFATDRLSAGVYLIKAGTKTLKVAVK
ncbi:MAG: T9SS type A sorting domain-containing protein, partial [Prevotellaceae bacterium]|nr:T9SS type A sorting domain-containing protein [Prevotellaceae bacterium]